MFSCKCFFPNCHILLKLKESQIKFQISLYFSHILFGYKKFKIQNNLTTEIFSVPFLNSRKRNWPYLLQWFKDSYGNMGISSDKVICASKPNSHCFIGNAPRCGRRFFLINIIAKNIMNAKYWWLPTLHKDIIQYC